MKDPARLPRPRIRADAALTCGATAGGRGAIMPTMPGPGQAGTKINQFYYPIGGVCYPQHIHPKVRGFCIC